MTTLRQILDQTLDLLQHPEFKSFGNLCKSRYQHSKGEEDKLIRQMMYEGGLGNSEEAKKKAAETHKKKVESGEWQEACKRAAKNRANWYKDPENYENFKEKIKKRDAKKRKIQSSGNNS